MQGRLWLLEMDLNLDTLLTLLCISGQDDAVYDAVSVCLMISLTEIVWIDCMSAAQGGNGLQRSDIV